MGMSRLLFVILLVASLSAVSAADGLAKLIITNTEYVLEEVNCSDVVALKKALQATKYKKLHLVPNKDVNYERVRGALQVIQEVGGISIGIVGDRSL